jgi:hypothetical protein
LWAERTRLAELVTDADTWFHGVRQAADRIGLLAVNEPAERHGDAPEWIYGSLCIRYDPFFILGIFVAYFEHNRPFPVPRRVVQNNVLIDIKTSYVSTGPGLFRRTGPGF